MESLCPCVRLCRPHVLSVPASFPKHWQIRISSLRQHSLDERCKFTGGALVGAVLAVAVGPCRSTAKWRRRPDLKSALPAAAFDADDVVVVYDRNSKQAGEVVVAVEQDSAMAPRPVSYAIVPSSDSAALLELARQRNLNDDCVERLRRDACACAVLPGGAMIEDLEMDPWPLLRELRYRTCLEHPSKDDIEALEETYFRPLRSLKAEWWKQPEALKSLAQQLDEVGFVLIDDFLPDEVIRRVKASNLDLYQNSEMQLGSTTGGGDRVGIAHRGDVLKWVGYDGDSEATRCAAEFAARIEEVIFGLCHNAADVVPSVTSALKGVQWRSETMFTCYPADSRARYFRHTDNSSGNGRLLTALVYLNENWQRGDGGELRLFHPGEKNLKVRMEIEPLWNRLLLFWSDDRSPHEVLSACKDRFAATVWYYDEKNPSIPLHEVGEPVGDAGSVVEMEQATTKPKGVGIRGAAPPPPGESPTASKAGLRRAAPPPAVPPPAAPATPTPAPESGQDEPVQDPQLKVLFDGENQEVCELLDSLSLDTALSIDLRSPAAEKALAAAENQWSELMKTQGVEGLIEEAGSLFLILPSGEVLKNGEREQWMLQYEIDYWQAVRPPSPKTRKRLVDTIFEPLSRVRKSFASKEGAWWATPEAGRVWIKALENEDFLVLDDFLPLADARELAKALEKRRPKMQPGRTDSELSAYGRGDKVLWLQPSEVPELGPLVEHTNALVSLLMDIPEVKIQARMQGITALSDAQFAVFPGSPENDDARYIRHVDNEDGCNGRLLTCTFYLNEDWDAEHDGGEIRLFEEDQKQIKVDVAPEMNRLVAFFSDSSVPHEVRRSRRDRCAITTWYINEELHLAYHQAEEEGQ